MCAPGYYSADPSLCLSSATCNPCPANTYSISWGTTQCLPCYLNSVSLPAATICNCLPGWILAGSIGNYVCSICPENTYAVGINSMSCIACPLGSAAPPGSTSCTGYQINAPWPGHGRYPNARNLNALFFQGPSTGNITWAYQTAGVIGHASPVISSDGTIYVGSSDGGLYAVTNSGSLKWVNYAFLSLSSQSAAIGANGNIYIYGHDNYLYSISSTGSLLWYRQLGDCCNYGCGKGCDSGLKSLQSQTSWPSPIIGPDGTIYIGANTKNYIYAVDSTGSTKRSIATLGPTLYTPALVNGTIFVNSPNWLQAYNLLGVLIWVR